MTSPTTSADAVSEAVRLLNDVGYHDAAANLSDYFLTQHAEAGAVEPFGYIDAEEMARHKREGAGGGIVCGNYSERYGRTTPLFLHPAQPASQQGEATGHGIEHYSDGKPVTLNWPMPIENLAGNLEYTAHPTGDRVRVTDAMVDRAVDGYWNAATADGARPGISTAWMREAIAAALDQEKNDGR